jgi:ribosomal protein L12E/L44/L45/RPP1/RPP2
MYINVTAATVAAKNERHRVYINRVSKTKKEEEEEEEEKKEEKKNGRRTEFHTLCGK